MNGSFAPVATRSMTPLTWPRWSSTTRTTKLARLTRLIEGPSAAFLRGRACPFRVAEREKAVRARPRDRPMLAGESAIVGHSDDEGRLRCPA